MIGEVSAEGFAADAALAQSSRTLDDVVAGRIAGDEEHSRRRLIDAEVAVSTGPVGDHCLRSQGHGVDI